MSDDSVNHGRRLFLTGSTCVVGATGVVAAAVPFIGSWQPSARAKAAGAAVTVNIGKLELGAMITVEWRGKPIYIVRRSDQTLTDLNQVRPLVADPDSAKSKQPEYIKGDARAAKGNESLLVVIGICTHLGCAPKFRPEVGTADLGGDLWFGGFFCPCHGSKFDLAGRVFNGAPAPTNLEVPPYRYLTDNTIIIGEDENSEVNS